MPEYRVMVSIFWASGDDLIVEAADEAAAEKLATSIVEERDGLGLYIPDLQEICISSVELIKDN